MPGAPPDLPSGFAGRHLHPTGRADRLAARYRVSMSAGFRLAGSDVAGERDLAGLPWYPPPVSSSSLSHRAGGVFSSIRVDRRIRGFSSFDDAEADEHRHSQNAIARRSNDEQNIDCIDFDADALSRRLLGRRSHWSTRSGRSCGSRRPARTCGRSGSERGSRPPGRCGVRRSRGTRRSCRPCRPCRSRGTAGR